MAPIPTWGSELKEKVVELETKVTHLVETETGRITKDIEKAQTDVDGLKSFRSKVLGAVALFVCVSGLGIWGLVFNLTETRQEIERVRQSNKDNLDTLRNGVYRELEITRQINLRQERVRPVLPGVSLGSDVSLGTICCIVRDTDGVYLLTARHVFTRDGATSIKALQPGPGVDRGDASKDVVADYIARASKLDAALARIRKNVEWIPEVAGVGRLSGVAGPPKPGEQVITVGRSTGTLRSVVIDPKKLPKNIDRKGIKETFGLDVEEMILLDENLLPGDTRAGDSGGAVLTLDRRLVGMIVGAIDTIQLAIPIQIILRELKVDLVVNKDD